MSSPSVVAPVIDARRAADGTVRVYLIGDHDSETAPALASMLEAVGGSPVTIVFAQTTFIDSAILHVLVDSQAGHGALDFDYTDAPHIARTVRLAGLAGQLCVRAAASSAV